MPDKEPCLDNVNQHLEFTALSIWMWFQHKITAKHLTYSPKNTSANTNKPISLITSLYYLNTII
jgi:hypothetical protein